MLFDAMCRIAENAKLDQIQSDLRHASLLLIPYLGNGDSLGVAGVDFQEAVEGFRMPWKHTVISDSLYCILVTRVGKRSMPVEFGDQLEPRAGEVLFKEGVIPPILTHVRCGTKDVGLESGDMFRVAIAIQRKRGVAMVCGEVGFAGVASSGSSIWELGHEIRFVHQLDGGRLGNSLIKGGDSDFSGMSRVVMTAINTAASQLTRAMRPRSWILRKVDAKVADPEKSVKIPRSHQRPHWIVIDDKERVEAFRQPSDHAADDDAPSGHAKVAPHPRRAHYRYIGDNENGTRKHTWVRACWVGSVEAEIRGGRYRVELDL